MRDALQLISEKRDLKASFAEKAAAANRAINDFIVGMAYTLRVMLSHLRLKRSQFVRLKANSKTDAARNHPDELQAVYSVFDIGAKSQRSSGPNPFVAFAHEHLDCGDDDGDDCTLDDESPTVILKQLVFGEYMCHASARMSDGRVVVADSYTEGEAFLVAHFTELEETLETDIPNKYLEPDGKFILRPNVAKPPGLKKKPAASASCKKRPAAKPDEQDAVPATPPKKRPAAKPDEDDAEAANADEPDAVAAPAAKSSRPRPALDLEGTMASLPEQARNQALGQAKSYTLRRALKTASIGVLLDKKCFYLCPVDLERVPDGLKRNKKMGVQINFAKDPAGQWELAKLVAGWLD